VDNLLFVPDIMSRYKVSAPTARKIMRQMHHMEKPKLAVTERALIAYEMEQGQAPGEKKPAQKKGGKKNERFVWVPGVSRVPMRV
jgi:hypothetical protein